MSLFRTTVFRLSGGEAWLLPRGAYHGHDVANVPLVLDGAGAEDAGIPYSFCALPGRYVSELCAMAARHCRGAAALVLSPAAALPGSALAQLIASCPPLTGARGAAADVDILATAGNAALAYRWTPQALDALREDAQAIAKPIDAEPWAALPVGQRLFDLRFLSGVDAGLDARMLRSMGWRARIVRVSSALAGPWQPTLPWFPNAPLIARLAAERWLAARQTGLGEAWAVLPHHAGDVLLAIDILRSAPCGVHGLVVNGDYAAIVRRALPGLPILTIDEAPISRGKFSAQGHPLNDEARYFEEVVLPSLPPEVAPVWLRPLRGYEEAATTLTAQLAFVLSDTAEMRRWPALRPGMALEPLRVAAGQADGVRRALLHIDGGWPLKVPPRAWLDEFLGCLGGRGWKVSVLSDRPLALPVPVHRFGTLEFFDQLLDAHDVLIGADSFPVHYANIHRGMPTICLFGPTSLSHLASARPNYRAMSAGMACSPCRVRAICPRFGTEHCRNFPSPAEIAALIDGSP